MNRMNPRKNEIDMLHGPLAGKILRFALPLAASSVLQQLFNAADLAVVGRFASSQAMAAVGSNGSVVGLLINLFVGLSVGANVVIGNLLGAGRRSEVPDAVHTVMSLALAAGAILLVLGVAVARPILQLMGAPAEVLNLAVLYLRIYFLGMPAIMLYNYGAAVLRSRGDSRRPFLALTLAGIVNVGLNLLFVIVFHLHVIGVALATVLSNCLSGGLTLWFLLTEPGEFRLNLKKLRIRREYFSAVVRIGLPAGLQGTVFSLSNVVIQSAVNSFGANCIAGMTAAQNFEFASFCLINAFAQTAVTFVSQNYGARDKARCRKVFAWCMVLALGIDFVVLLVIQLFRGSLIRIFTTDEDVIAFAMVRFRWAVGLHFLCATYEIPGGSMRGMNRSLAPAIISTLGTCAFRLAYVFFFFPAHRSVETLVQVYPLSWILTCVVMNTAHALVLRRAFRTVPK